MDKNERPNGKNLKPSNALSSDTRKSLLVLFLLAAAGLSALALLGLGGPFGSFWQTFLTSLFGVGSWFFPVYLIVLAALVQQHYPRRGAILFGLSLLVVSLLALIDLRVPLHPKVVPLHYTPPELGGGYIGLFLRYPLETIFGPQAALLILILLVLASILVVFDTTLPVVAARVWVFLQKPFRFLGGFFRGLVTDRSGDPPVSAVERAPFRHRFTVRDLESEGDSEPEQEALIPSEETSASPVRAKSVPKYKPVAIDLPLTLLNASTEKPTSGDIREQKLVIQRTLESFGIKVEMGEVSVGPTVTQYTLKPEEGVKLSALTSLHNDLALALAAHPIRIEAPIPGRSLVGIEVPNRMVATVQLRDILEAETFQKRRSNLELALGKDVSGAPWSINLERLPHLLVAGSTGSGKSVCLNGIIISLLYQNNPQDLRFILVDPKRVEFSVYQHMPHLLTPVITEVPATVNALKWLLKEMDRRFTLLQQSGDRNIQTYNQRAEEKMSYIVLMIDELADLMVAAASEVEAAIIRLAQMSRAVGIHLILATQRPSVDVITGLIKANITARIAFSVASLTDSRTILDSSGAEKLVGRGDLLYVSAEVTKPKRLQGAFLSDDEIKKVVDFLKNKAAPDYIPEVTEKPKVGLGGSGGNYESDDGDDLYGEAQALVVQTGKASASFLQRRLKVGYARAARLLDLLEANGVIGPGDGAKPRDVLIRADGHDTLDGDDDFEDAQNEEENGEANDDEFAE